MPTESQSLVVISCRVLQDMLEGLLPAGLAGRVTFLDYGLHRTPAQMTPTLQAMLEELPAPSRVVLGYGLCGNGTHTLRAGRHTLFLPRVNDCIALLLGSHEAYIREFEAEPGTYYLSKGWLESGSQPLKEYQECVARYGRESADWIMDLQYRNYKRLALVAHSQADLERYRPQAQEIARFCAERWGFRYEEILGSDAYVRRLAALAVAPDETDRDFICVPPGGEIHQDQFAR
jgi:hypothetical protein